MFFKNITPKICFGCKKESKCLCVDYFAILEIINYQYCLCDIKPKKKIPILSNGKCQKCRNKKMNELFFTTSYYRSDNGRMCKNFKKMELKKIWFSCSKKF